MSSRDKPTPRNCSVADALELLGDRWSLLVVRELLYDVRRFSELRANTGAPRDVLTARLRRLEAHGLLERRPYQERPLRHEYRLTPAGRGLRPVLLTLREWGNQWGDGDTSAEVPAVRFAHACGAELHVEVACAACGETVEDGSLRVLSSGLPAPAA